MPNPFRTSNPALNEKAFQSASGVGIGEAMTVQGTVNKTGVLLLCVIATSSWTWGLSHSPQPESAMPWMIGGIFGGLIAALATIFKPNWAPISAPVYALFEGLFLGGISAVLDKQYPGIAFHAIGLTFGVLAVMLIAYKTGTIRATQNFRLGVIAATGGIALFYMLEIVLGFFHVAVPAINGSGIIGIGFSLFVVIIASLNLVLDFDMIETGARMNAPRYMEWYGFRPDGHPRLALSRDASPSLQAPAPQLSARSTLRNQSPLPVTLAAGFSFPCRAQKSAAFSLSISQSARRSAFPSAPTRKL